MKEGKVKTNLMAAVALLLLSACSGSEENQLADALKPELARFTATIAGDVTSRAYDQSWEAGDNIGISGTSADKAYTNVRYVTPNGGNLFIIGTVGSEIYYQDDKEVTFTAYYPWNDLAGATTIDVDTREQANQKNFDFLWAQQTGSKANPGVPFRFAHKMAKFVMTLQKGSDVSYAELQAVVMSLGGFKNNGTFDVTNGTATATGDNLALYTFTGNVGNNYNAPFVADDAAETLVYNFILFPQVLDAPLPIAATLPGLQTFAADLDFTVANADAGDANPANEWVAGRQYNISVTLNKTGLTVDGCTIDAWTEANGGNVDAE